MSRKLMMVVLLALIVPALAWAAKQEKIARERIEWCDIWVTQADESKLPRVLLIGDSISRGYYKDVEKALEGKANLARLATSAALGSPELLAEIRMLLAQYKFDVIHFNVGLHGWGYTEEEYKAGFPKLIETLRQGAPEARLIWATTTPMRVKDDLKKLSEQTERVKARNRIATEIVEREKIPTDDLFGVVIGHPEFQASDGVHYNAKGYAALGGQVAKKIEGLLP